MRKCKWCGAEIEYVSTPTWGYWAGRNGRYCDRIDYGTVPYSHFPSTVSVLVEDDTAAFLTDY